MTATLQSTVPGSQYRIKIDANTRMYICLESNDLSELEQLIDEKALQGYCVEKHSVCPYTSIDHQSGGTAYFKHYVIMRHVGITHGKK